MSAEASVGEDSELVESGCSTDGRFGEMLESDGAILEMWFVRMCSFFAIPLNRLGLLEPVDFVLPCMRKYVARKDVMASITPVQTFMPLRMAELVWPM